MTSDNLIVGLDTSDDAAVYKISDTKAMIHTVDFFTPVVDDPYAFGQIAASNALSDIYAMGGKPLLALNVVVFPDELAETLLPEILKGGADKVMESGAIIAGGHSIKGPEPVYGLSVVGEAALDKIMTNSKAKPGDILILTKPLGIGIATTALKREKLDPESVGLVIDVMRTLNKAASEAALEIGVNSITDITGFGLLGHASEMAEASKVTLKISAGELPILPGIREMAAMGFLPGGLYHNKDYFQKKVRISHEVSEDIADICFDPQTSGGLLISVQKDKATPLLYLLKSKGVKDARAIGEVLEPSKHGVLLET